MAPETSSKSTSPTTRSTTPKSKSKGIPPHPPYAQIIDEAVGLAEIRTGISRQKIASYVSEEYHLDITSGQVKSHIKRAISNALEDGRILQDRNTFYPSPELKKEMRGASPEVVKKKAPAKKTPAKKAATTKKAPAKKAAAKKTKAK